MESILFVLLIDTWKYFLQPFTEFLTSCAVDTEIIKCKKRIQLKQLPRYSWETHIKNRAGGSGDKDVEVLFKSDHCGEDQE